MSALEVHPVRRLLQTNNLPDGFLFVVAGVALCLGLSFLWVPELYSTVRTFRETFALIEPWIWAVALIVPGVWIVVASRLRRTSAWIPCWIVAVVFVGFSISTVPTIADGTGAPSALIIYTGFSVVCVLTGGLAKVWDRINLVPQ